MQLKNQSLVSGVCLHESIQPSNFLGGEKIKNVNIVASQATQTFVLYKIYPSLYCFRVKCTAYKLIKRILKSSNYYLALPLPYLQKAEKNKSRTWQVYLSFLNYLKARTFPGSTQKAFSEKKTKAVSPFFVSLVHLTQEK